ncbi:MAG: MotA/TolQ/ExbB proton channel family protein [Elusimicrobia bacterium]|nr:MotA/TolQ/ExbB proton channel family protein [Elusimicrobiota bacterium]
MDSTSVLGVLGVFVLAGVAIATGQVSSAFLNAHGFLVVIGGAFVAMMINTPAKLMIDSMKSVFVMFRAAKVTDPKDVVPLMISASQNVHARGMNALGGMDGKVAAGFLTRAAQIAMEFKDPKYVQEVLESELKLEFEHHNEIVNFYRTLSILFPMFGLIGTLLGIVDVLKHIENPESVGPAMAVAITSAFYGISLANLFATPVAGKLRLKFLEEYVCKAVIVEGMVEILKGTVPVLVERRLEAYILDKKEG